MSEIGFASWRFALLEDEIVLKNLTILVNG